MTRLIHTLVTAFLLGLPLSVSADAPDRSAEPDNRNGVIASVGESVRHGWDATREGGAATSKWIREKAARADPAAGNL